MFAGTVVKVGERYRMYYAGHNGGAWAGIGLATSKDGIHWTRYAGNPIIARGSGSEWDGSQVFGTSAVFDGSVWYLFYQGNSSIGLATSNDGISFTKSPANPVLQPTSGWESALGAPSVLLEGGTFILWYGGNNGPVSRIGRATSPDGTHWSRDSANPILSPSPGWESASVYNPTVIKIGSTYCMLYAGDDGRYARMGLAASNDGSTWTKAAANPLWEETPLAAHTYPGGLQLNGARLWAWFTGSDGSHSSIGAASLDLQRLGVCHSASSAHSLASRR